MRVTIKDVAKHAGVAPSNRYTSDSKQIYY